MINPKLSIKFIPLHRLQSEHNFVTVIAFSSKLLKNQDGKLVAQLMGYMKYGVIVAIAPCEHLH